MKSNQDKVKKTKAQKLKDKRSKADAKKAKIEAKFAAKAVLMAAVLSAVFGCATSEPASRVTRAEYGDIVARFENSSGNTVYLTIGDGAYASADSKGSSETTTANPTNDVRPQTTLTYGLASGSSSGTTWLEDLTSASAKGLAAWLKSGTANGTMSVTKADGSTETVTCKDGKCTTSSGDCITCTP